MRHTPLISCIFVLYLLSLASESIAQRQEDSLQYLKRNLARVFTAAEWMEYKALDSMSGKSFDTSLHLFHRFDPAYVKEIAWQDLGMPCSPIFPLEMNPIRSHGFQLTRDYYQSLFQSDKKYYRTPIALSDLKYTQGAPNLLFLEALHTQNITESWNAGIEYRHSAVSNVYFENLPNRERTRMSTLFSTRLFSSYQSKDSAYISLLDIELHRLRTQESGGLTDIDRFEVFHGQERELNNSAHLSNALNRMNRNQVQYVQQWRKNRMTLKHESLLGREMNRFESDPQSWFQRNYFSEETFDSLRHFSWHNAFWMNLNFHSIALSTALHHGYHRVSQPQQTVGRYNNTGYQMKGTWTAHGKQAFAHWKHDLSGYNKNDYRLMLLWKQDLGRQEAFEANLIWQQRRPDFLQQYFVSNHYIWGLQPLNQERHLHGFLRMQERKDRWNTELQLGQIEEAVYFSNTGIPLQSNEPWRYARIKMHARFKLGVFHFNPQILLQQQSRELWAYPAAVAKISAYANLLVFKGNMRIHTGIDFLANSAYHMNAWNPATRQFIPGTLETPGRQYNLNAFLNAQIRTVRAFILYQRINDHMNIPLYASEGIPQLPAVLRFGIGWTMYN